MEGGRGAWWYIELSLLKIIFSMYRQTNEGKYPPPVGPLKDSLLVNFSVFNCNGF